MKANRILTAALALALTLAVGLTACSGGTDESLTPEEVMAKAQQAMDSVTSMGYDMTMQMTMEADVLEEAIEISSTTSADAILDPLSMKAEMTVDMGALGDSVHNTLYLLERDGGYVMAVGTLEEDGTTSWQTSTDSGTISGLEQLDGKASMDAYLSSAQSFTQGATETINGMKATRYDGVISGSDLETALESSGLLDQLNTMGLGDISTMLSGLADLPISIWIAKDTYYPVQYQMDMAAMMQSMLTQSLGTADGVDLGLTVSQMTVSMTLRDLNNIPDIQLPSEVLGS